MTVGRGVYRGGVRAIQYYEQWRSGCADPRRAARGRTGPGRGRVQVHRSGVNPTDWKSRRGSARARARAVAPPQVPGQDGAGVVDAVGNGVDAALVGGGSGSGRQPSSDPRAPRRNSRWSRSGQLVPLPDDASFDLGAALGIPFLTAHRCLTVTEDGPQQLGPGTLQDRVVLVAGGAGAVGNAAIQLARWSDATVISTVSSPAKAQSAVAAGADHVINYRRQDVVEEIRRLAQSRGEHHRRGGRGGQCRHRRRGDRPAWLGRDVRRRRRQRGHPADHGS